MNQLKKIIMYTDGACRGNPGPGGWGVLLRYDRHERTLKGAEKFTTNNRMELMAAIEGLRALKMRCEVDLTTDSHYVKNGVESWLVGWKKNNWRTADKKLVKNQDLWLILDELLTQHVIHWHWVKGHSGDYGNEWADRLANEAIDELLGQS